MTSSPFARGEPCGGISYELDNTGVAPHIGSTSVASRTKMITTGVSNLVTGLSSKMRPDLVNNGVLGIIRTNQGTARSEAERKDGQDDS